MTLLHTCTCTPEAKAWIIKLCCTEEKNVYSKFKFLHFPRPSAHIIDWLIQFLWLPVTDITVTESHTDWITFELSQAKRGLMVIFEILGRDISVIEYYKSFHWFFAHILENKCNGILLNHLKRMFDLSYCDVIYYVIYVICSLYVRKAISPLFAWPSSFVFSLRIWLFTLSDMHKWIKELVLPLIHATAYIINGKRSELDKNIQIIMA